jgi:hypothetical protein
MPSALASTIFAQQMALREALLQQQREQGNIDAERKLRMMTEANRSTDLALQAQGKAMDRRAQSAKELSQAAAYTGQQAPQFADDTPGAVAEAAQVGTAMGGMSQMQTQQRYNQQNQLEMMKEMAAQMGRAYTQGQTNQRFAVTAGQRDQSNQLAAKGVAIRQQELGLQKGREPAVEAELWARTGMENRSPAGMLPAQQNAKDASLKRFTDIELQYPTAFGKTTDFGGNDALKQVNQVIRDKVRAAKEEARRQYDLAAGQETDPLRAHAAGDLAMQQVYDNMITNDTDLQGAMQQYPRVHTWQPVQGSTGQTQQAPAFSIDPAIH